MFTAPQELGDYLRGRSGIGFVPTMGALHQGHSSLISRARSECSTVVVSIFVNPLQFGPGEDLSQYPRSPELDWEVCQAGGVDVLFCPTVETLVLAADMTQVVPPLLMTSGLCGRSRPGHFTGVATIVVKLLQIVHPQRMYLGQKDGQQVAILRRVLTDLHLGVDLRVCPTVRLPSGLALSSRNQYLTAAELAIAPELYRGLQAARVAFDLGTMDAVKLIETVQSHVAKFPALTVDYVELVDAVSLSPLTELSPKTETLALLAIAAKIGSTRLIDNLLLPHGTPT